MNIKLLIGPYRSGKTGKLIGRVREYLAEHPFSTGIFLVPSARPRQVLKRRLARLADGGCFGLNVMTIYEACEMALHSFGQSFRLASPQIRAALVAKALLQAEAAGGLKALSRIGHYKGTGAAILKLFDEFERSALSPEALLARLKESCALESFPMEMARVYAEYWRQLEMVGYVDRHKMAMIALEHLLSADGPGGFHVGFLAIDGFDRFAPLQTQVIRGLAKFADRCEVCFDYLAPEEDRTREYVWKESSYAEVLRTLSPLIVEHCQPARTDPVETTVFNAVDRFEEMCEIARKCKKLILCRQCPPSQIAVVARDIDAYTSTVAPAFEEACLPYFLDHDLYVRDLPALQFYVRLLKLASCNYQRADVLALLRSAFIDLGKISLSDQAVDEIDRMTGEHLIVSGMDRWLEFAERIQEPWASSLVAFLEQLLPLSEPVTILLWAEWVEDLLDAVSLNLAAAVEEGCLSECSHGQGRVFLSASAVRSGRQSLAALRSALKSLIQEDTALGLKPISYEQFLERLENVLEKATLENDPEYSESITICGADVVPNQRFRHVFIAGLVENEFPRKGTRAGFAGADELGRWRSFGVNLDNPRDHSAFEWALFRSICQLATDGLHLSFPAYEMSGEENLPSFFLGEVLGVHKEPPLSAPFAASRITPVSAADFLRGWLWQNHHLSSLAEIEDLPWLSEKRGQLMELAGIGIARAAGCAGVYDASFEELVKTGCLSISLPKLWSASALNDYGQCPFKYWMGHVLKLSPYSEPEDRLSPMLIGSTYHLALQYFYERLKQAGLSLRSATEQMYEPILDRSITDALSWMRQQREFRCGDFFEFEQQELTFRLRRFVAKERERAQRDGDGFEPHMFEVAFGYGTESAYPEVEIRCGEGKVSLCGRIDRIDLSESCGCKRVRLVDYKKSSAPVSVKDARSGRNIQLPLYALAVQRAIMPSAQVLRAMYLSVSSGDPSGQLDFTSADCADLLEHTERLVAGIVSGIRAGDFAARPNGRKVCQVCDHATVCRIKEKPPISRNDLEAAGG